MGTADEVPDETIDASDSPGGAKKASRELAAGSSLGKYRLERVLGSGGMGVVWAAHDPDLERAVALKVLKVENAARELRTRLLREARAMARLKHANVLTVYEVDSEADRDFIAMELVDGASLDGWVATRPAQDEIWQAILAAGRGLAAAHHAGLVHRDFKPHNVLRSQDGRVLVTDFGLARGRGEDGHAIAMDVTLPAVAASGLDVTVDAAAAPATSASPTQRSSLDAPLTQTGVMIGTPAYMAPEQFLGATPDPRTDQFAFCVTAWQLLTGERPFRGTTLEELKRAAETGVAGVKAKLPRAVRGVLARGLSPDPAKRWPDMNALLAALEHARAAPRRLLRIGFGVVVLALGVALVIQLARKPAAEASSVCELSPEDEMAKGWGPGSRGRWAHLADNPGLATAAAELDAFAVRWIDSYRKTCDTARTTKTFAKLGCLLGERDQVANVVELVSTVPPHVVGEIEMGGVLPRTQACDGNSPVTPPILPDDPESRRRIKELRPQLIAARFGPGKLTLPRMPGLLVEAEALGWDPIVAEAHQAYAIAAQRGLEWELARDHYKQANQLARRTHHYHLEADTWIGLLSSELDAASDPGDDKPFLELVAQARLATQNAGDDPVFIARITQIEGIHAISRGRVDDGIAKYEQARLMELSARDVAMAMRFTVDTVEAMLRRGRPDDLDAAWKLLVETDRIVTDAKISKRKLDKFFQIGALLAELRGDPVTAHTWADREGPPEPEAGATPRKGRVVDADGKPVAGATVVAWKGVIEGDAKRVYVRTRFDGDLVTTAADGTFTVRATSKNGIIAEQDNRRSQPRAIGDGELVLTLGPTREISGVVASDGAVNGVAVFAHYELPGSAAREPLAWRVVSPVSAARNFRLSGIPGGNATLRIDSTIDPNRPMRKIDFGPVRDVAVLRWPAGSTIDVIVHGTTDHETMVWLFRGKRTAKTRAELERLFEQATEGVVHPALVVGIGDQTPEGMKRYRRADRHAVFLNNAPGEVTACIARPKPEAPASCQTFQLGAGDGRGNYPTVAVEFPLP